MVLQVFLQYQQLAAVKAVVTTQELAVQEDLEAVAELTAEPLQDLETQAVIHQVKEIRVEQDLHKRAAAEELAQRGLLETLEASEELELELKFLQQQVFKAQVHH